MEYDRAFDLLNLNEHCLILALQKYLFQGSKVLKLTVGLS